MAAETRSVLKGHFDTGDVPTEANFDALIDSQYHRDDLGWADYADTQYTALSPFSLNANTDTILPNNGSGGVQTYEPDGVTLYANDKITGITGESRLITVEYKITPSSASATYVETWFDIGGSVGELYRRITGFPKGSGVERGVLGTTYAHTLGTWETNGATVYVRSNGACTIHSVRYVIGRTTKVFA